MDSLGQNRNGSAVRTGETEAHLRLKRLALLWAQAHGYKICALEVSLPRCRYRADVAAYRQDRHGVGSTIIFECKQARPDLRSDNGCAAAIAERLTSVNRRREILEKHLRIHYPALRVRDSLFEEFDSHNFAAIGHRGYLRVAREIGALQHRLFDCTKFETLVRYRCANLFFLVLPNELFCETEIPLGWGALVEQNGALVLARKATWHEVKDEHRLRFLERLAMSATRLTNRAFDISFETLQAAQCRS